MLGISELKDLATAVAQTANSIDAILADGKVDLRDIGALPNVLSALKGFIDVDFKQVIPQATDLSPSEALELAAHFASVFNLSNDKIENAVELGLNVVVKVGQAVQDIIAVIRQIRPAA